MQPFVMHLNAFTQAAKHFCCPPQAQYIVVMLAHKTDQPHLASNLEEFLGDAESKEMATW